MKIYNNPLFLQKIIKDNCSNQLEYLFKSDIVLKFDSYDNNLILNNLKGEPINMDSSIAYMLSDYYKSAGDALKRIETITEQKPQIDYNNTKGLGILFYGPFINFVNKEFKIQRGIKDESYKDNDAIIDSIGGVHDEGVGWAPDGTYCGECSNTTCIDCKIAYEERK